MAREIESPSDGGSCGHGPRRNVCPDGGAAVYSHDEGGLTEGGTYAIYECPVHGRHYVELPD